MNGECLACGELQLFNEMFTTKVPQEKLLTPVVWKRWDTHEGRMVRVEKTGTIEDLIVEFSDELPKFLIHSFVKREQSKIFDEIKADAKNNETVAVLQVDFAKNFAAVWQDEVQSAHWHQKQTCDCFHQKNWTHPKLS